MSPPEGLSLLHTGLSPSLVSAGSDSWRRRGFRFRFVPELHGDFLDASVALKIIALARFLDTRITKPQTNGCVLDAHVLGQLSHAEFDFAFLLPAV